MRALQSVVRVLPFALGAVALSIPAACGGSDATSEPAAAVDASVPVEAATDAGMTPDSPSCGAAQTLCGGSCVFTASDGLNCGACGKACTSTQQCTMSACVTPSAGYAARHVFLGESDRAGTRSQDAWKSYGRNIDGIVSSGATPNGECKPINGAPAAQADDGVDGIDNAFGKSIVPIFLAFAPAPSSSVNGAIEIGARTPMVDFGGAFPASAGPFHLGLVTAETTTLPQWMGADSRPIAESSTTAGKATLVYSGATLTAGVLASGDSPTPFVLEFALSGSSLQLPIHAARISMTISADQKTATNGTISGVVKTEDLVTAFQKVAGQISASLCTGSTIDSIDAQIRQASDILADGTQDPNSNCDAISIGVGFDAVRVAVGPVATPVAPGKDPCAP